jgi:hypothetical protein
MLFIEMRQFHSLKSVLDFHPETSYSFLIFVFRTLGKSSTVVPTKSTKTNSQNCIFGGKN